MKRTTLKRIKQLACHTQLDLTEALHKNDRYRFHKDGLKYSLAECICESCEGWPGNYWYSGVERDAMTYYGDDMRAVLVEKGLDISCLDEDSDRYDEHAAELFETDAARAYTDAWFDAEAGEYYKQIVDRVEDFIREVDAPYYCLLSCDGETYREVKDIHAATDVVFGFTRQWHEQYVAGLNDYNDSRPAGHYLKGMRYSCDPECIDRDAEEHIDDIDRYEIGDIQEGASDEIVEMFFKDYAECIDVIREENARHAAAVQAAIDADIYETKLRAQISEITRRMGH